MPEAIDITPATADDLPSIVQIEKASFPMPWCREFFAEELGAAGRFNLVARRGERVVGYIFTMWLLDEMHVNKIAVAEDARRSGVADALMARCLTFAAAHGVETIGLEVRQSNEGAQRFYTHLGFTSEYIRRRYYPDGEAAVVMICNVK